MPPPTSCRIEGRATLTMTASRVMTKKPSTAAASAAPAKARDRAAPAAVVVETVYGLDISGDLFKGDNGRAAQGCDNTVTARRTFRARRRPGRSAGQDGHP